MSLVRPPRAPNGGDYAADVTGFLIGLAISWWSGWQTDALIWSLWLASLGVGYATIVLTLARAQMASAAGGSAVAGILAKLFLLAFFSVHFGGFHFVHSIFLNLFFPAGAIGTAGSGDLMQRFLPDYQAVLHHCWPWLVAAAIAERRSLFAPEPRLEAAMFAPYANVVRLHLLIFFFAGAIAVGLPGAVVNVVVQVVYFWPWRRSFVFTPPAPATP